MITKERRREISRNSARKMRSLDPERFRATDQKSYVKNIDKRREKSRKYYHKNIDKCRANSRRLQKFYRGNPDYPEWNVKMALRSRLKDLLRGKRNSATALSLLGCSLSDFVAYLTSRFKPGMSWSNYGLHGWHIDHIRPCASFDLSVESQRQECFHYKNMQPLWASENLSKHAHYE